MAIAGSFKLALFLSNIWSCNDSADPPLIFHSQFPGNFTAAIQIGKIKRLFISTDLQYRICRCVNDHSTCIDFFFPKFFNNFCTTGTLITNHTLAASLLQFLDQFLWKSCLCKSNKRFLRINSHHFPMTGHRIFSITGLTDSHVTTDWFLYTFHHAAFMQVQHSKFLKIWDIQSPHSIQDMSKCIHTFVTKFLRIRHCTDSK